jgi:plasmid stabilization system protein ParE
MRWRATHGSVPRPPKAILAALARADLKAIARLVRLASGRDRADGGIRRTLHGADSHAATSLAGAARPELGSEVRAFVAMRWNVLYRPVAGGILVLRVIDGARDLGRAWRAPGGQGHPGPAAAD